MDGSAGFGLGMASTAASVVIAWIQQKGNAGVTALKERVDAIDTRLKAAEGSLGAAAKAAGLQAEFESLRTWADGQVKGLAGRVHAVERQAQRSQTGSYPAVVDEEARRKAEDAQRKADEAMRRVEAMEREQAEDQRASGQLQVQITKTMTMLDLLMDGKIVTGGKRS